jgi:hypothetical protein
MCECTVKSRAWTPWRTDINRVLNKGNTCRVKAHNIIIVLSRTESAYVRGPTAAGLFCAESKQSSRDILLLCSGGEKKISNVRKRFPRTRTSVRPLPTRPSATSLHCRAPKRSSGNDNKRRRAVSANAQQIGSTSHRTARTIKGIIIRTRRLVTMITYSTGTLRIACAFVGTTTD